MSKSKTAGDASGQSEPAPAAAPVDLITEPLGTLRRAVPAEEAQALIASGQARRASARDLEIAG